MQNGLQIDEITEWNNQDLNVLCSLLIAAVDNGASIGFSPPLSDDDSLDYWQGVLSQGVRLWAARYNGEIVGTVQLHLSIKQNGAHRAEIAKLMVHPHSRRLGIARRLMAVAEQAAVQVNRSLVVLDTRAGDPSNILYRSLGFVEAGRIPQYARSADGHLNETVFYYKLLTGSPGGVFSAYLSAGYHRRRTGLNHVAFHAGSRTQVDELTELLREKRIRILYEDRHPHAGGPDHYAVFFEDPDRIKVEVVGP